MRCGEGCHGLRVGVRPEEQAGLLESARRLGVPDPLEGGMLRQEGGVCVFYADGCRLHAELAPEAKPAVCRQFPFVYSGPFVGIDPTCFHADPSPDGEAPETSVPDGFSGPVSTYRLAWDDLSLGWRVKRALARVAPDALTTRIGPLARAFFEPIRGAEPAPAEPWQFETRVRTALDFDLVGHPDPASLLVGGCQLITGARVPPGQGFAAFMRVLRSGQAVAT